MQYRIVTDRQTDKQTDGHLETAKYAHRASRIALEKRLK